LIPLNEAGKMILPVVAYGHPILRKEAEDIEPGYPELKKLIADMWETMYHTNGVGLAAPQINKSIRLFVIDTIQIVENFDEEDKLDYPNEKPVKKVFINAHIVEEQGDLWSYNEGCLSIPKVREDIKRKQVVTINYLDENFEEQEETFSGITGRVIQHEYDHIDGKLFIDYIAPLKKRLLKKKLDDISAGKVKVDYRMLFPK
jgi:peptide deformylase